MMLRDLFERFIHGLCKSLCFYTRFMIEYDELIIIYLNYCNDYKFFV